MNSNDPLNCQTTLEFRFFYRLGPQERWCRVSEQTKFSEQLNKKPTIQH